MSEPSAPVPRWNDDRLDDLAHAVRALGPLATQVARHDAVLDQLVDDLGEFKAWIGDVEGRLTRRLEEAVQAQQDFQREYREDRDRARQGRGAIVAAAITTAGVVVAAVVGAVALIWQHGGFPT